MKYVSLDEIEKLFNQMISDANSSMYPEGKVLEMKEFNMFSCGKASIEVAKERINSLNTIDISIIDEMIQENLEYPENDHNLGYRSSLQELKERLSLNK